VFRVATLNQKVTLGAEMSEEMALRVLFAKILAFCWCVSVSVVVKDVVFREIASTFQKVATNPLCESLSESLTKTKRRSRRKCQKEKETQQA